MVLLISYDLNGHERPEAYDDVAHVIRTNAISYRKPLYSQWFVETNESCQSWHEKIKAVTDTNDHWFICPVGSTRQGWLPNETWDWLNART
jgi:hypothetical protein